MSGAEVGEDGQATVAVTWYGEKSRAGSSHMCVVREGETNEGRKEALDQALAALNVDLEALLKEDQVGWFVDWRPGALGRPNDVGGNVGGRMRSSRALLMCGSAGDR
jgi:hypothetical protein